MANPIQARSRGHAVLGLLAIGIVAASLSGCGRRGQLEAPPDPAVAAAPADGSLQPLGRRPKREPIKPPKDSFILDPLL